MQLIFHDDGTAAGASIFYDKATGNVGIGTSNPTNRLAVNGMIKAQGIRVSMDGWADFVFEDGYRLMPLRDIERHIQEHGHLPGIPSAKEVVEGDLDLGDMQRRLLQKLEELTLHAISLEKENRAIRRRLERMEKLNDPELTGAAPGDTGTR